MSIEHDIKQSTFQSEHHKAFINLIYTHNWATEKLKPIFEKEGLTLQQFNILRILRGSAKPLSTLQIRERMLDKMSDTSRIVDRLIIKGLTKKKICKADKRLVDISITEKGNKVLAKLDLQQNKLESIINALSTAEAKSLNKLLDKIRKPV